ncbi:MAG: hypothetical protein ABH829_03475 [archaeon]
MEFPGISKKLVEELDAETQRAARQHIAEIQQTVLKKRSILENKDANEAFLQFQGFSKLDDYLKIIPKDKKLYSKLKQLKAEIGEFRSTFDEEARLVLELKRFNEASKMDKTLLEELERLKSEISDDLIIGVLVEDQVSSLERIRKLCGEVSHSAPPEIQAYVSQLDSVISLMENTTKTERDSLELLYNILNIPGWRELYETTIEGIE